MRENTIKRITYLYITDTYEVKTIFNMIEQNKTNIPLSGLILV